LSLVLGQRTIVQVNRKALFEFIVYGLKYVFPAKLAEIARGIPTTFSAPGLKGELMGTGDFALKMNGV